MKKAIITMFALVASAISYGEDAGKYLNGVKPEFVFELGGAFAPVLSYNLFGVSVDIKYYPKSRFATGINVSWLGKNISETFSYDIEKPYLNYTVIGWINQYDLFQKERIRVNLNINNGLAISQLADNDVKETYSYWTEWGLIHGESPKKIAESYYYILEPGFDISIRVFSQNSYPDIYLTSKTKYRFVFGESKFGETGQFSNYYFGLGVSFVGFIMK